MAASTLCCVTVTIILILNGSPGFNCQRLFYDIVGPQNITRRSGESNVYIPCSIPGIYFPMWRINDIYYEAFSLPEGLIPASYGLLIPTVGIYMDGWSFQCLASTGYRTDVHISTVGVLTVENETAPGLSFSPIQVTKFDLDHQKLVFQPRYKFLAWKSANSSCTLFRMNTTTCAGTIIREWPEGTIQGTQLNVTSKNTSSQECLNFFRINAVDQQNGSVCQEMKQSFQIKKSDITVDMQVPLNGFCVHILTPRGSFPYIVLPRNNTSSTDCICGYAILGRDSCTTTSECSCGNETIFNETLDVCSIDLDNVTYYAVCFYNLTVQMNNTYIHMYESIKECHECSGPMRSVRENVPFRLYFKTFKIVEVLPNQPSIPPVTRPGNICFQSVNSEGILLTHFIVYITDATKQSVYNKTVFANNNSIVCTPVGNLLQDSICSPFNITVEAHNQHGKTASYNVTNTFNNSDVCSCISKNIMISKPVIKVTNDDSEVQVAIKCNTTYLSDVWLNVSMGAKDLNVSISCSKEQFAYLRGVTCGHEYSVSISWYHSGENQYHLRPCLLAQNIPYKHKKCSGNGFPPWAGVFIFVAVIVMILLVLCSIASLRSFVKKRRSNESVTFTSVNSGSQEGNN